MPRTSPSLVETLILSSLSRRSMHGYEIKLEMRYKHVSWWASFEHGHLYAALARLERDGLVRGEETDDPRKKRILHITDLGRARLREDLRAIADGPDRTFTEVDVYVACCFVLPREEALDALDRRAERLREQIAAFGDVIARMSEHAPASGHAIMRHRREHLEREVDFCATARDLLAAQPDWTSHFGEVPIEDFARSHGVDVGDDDP
jgi:DNA-binding PadR family transcriptional regulator